jgi:hypothetical protein
MKRFLQRLFTRIGPRSQGRPSSSITRPVHLDVEAMDERILPSASQPLQNALVGGAAVIQQTNAHLPSPVVEQAHSYYDYTRQLDGHYDYSINMPDFDQLRAALPNEGKGYCVPTSTVDALAFLANHGHPEVLPGLGAQDWSNPKIYDRVTNAISSMGSRAFMATDPNSGTGVQDASNGLGAWLNSNSPHNFRVDVCGTDSWTIFNWPIYGNGYVPSIDEIAPLASRGALVLAEVGFYQQTGTGVWHRAYGHCFPLTEVHAVQGTYPKDIGITDPYSDWTKTTNHHVQSPFRTDHYQVVSEVGRFDDNDDGTAHPRERVVGLGGKDRNAFLNEYIIITPLAGANLTSADTHPQPKAPQAGKGIGVPSSSRPGCGGAASLGSNPQDSASALDAYPVVDRSAVQAVSLPGTPPANQNGKAGLALGIPSPTAVTNSPAVEWTAEARALDRAFAEFETISLGGTELALPVL